MRTQADKVTVLSPTAILGYGFPETSFIRGMAFAPDVIAIDAGSVDPGPYYLGSGTSFVNPRMLRRDLRLILRHALPAKIPVVIGSAGGSGAKPHVEGCLDVLGEVLRELGASPRVGVIYADIAKERVLRALAEKTVSPLPGAPELTPESLRETTHIVAQMGVEPFMEAYAQDFDIIVAGRAFDPAVFAAVPMARGFDTALSLHLGKILECAAIAATPGSGADCVVGVLEREHFTLHTLSDERIFTPASVAAHGLYEKSNPYFLYGPGGRLDLREVRYDDEGNGTVRVSGTRFDDSGPYTLKIEGSRRQGERCVCVAGVRCPVMISRLDGILEAVGQRVRDVLAEEGVKATVRVDVYGRDAVLREWEFASLEGVHEVGLLMDALGETAEDAQAACSLMRSTLLHYGYPGRISTAGNLAFPFSPSDLPGKSVYAFSLYHLLSDISDIRFPVNDVSSFYRL